MIRINLQQFGGRGGSSGGGGGGVKAQTEKSKQELPEEIERRITDGNGNVKEIAGGFRYVIDYMNGLKDVFSAAEAREVLEGFHYDKETGTFRSDTNRNREYKVTLAKSKAKASANAKSSAKTSTSKAKSGGKTRMMTALVRDKNGNLRTVRYSDYRNQKEYGSDLRGNGYQVLKIWNGDKKDAEVDKWEFLNRKGGRSSSRSGGKKR